MLDPSKRSVFIFVCPTCKTEATEETESFKEFSRSVHCPKCRDTMELVRKETEVITK